MRTEMYIIAIQEGHGCCLTTGDCLYATYAEAEAILKVRRSDGHSDYLKIFTLRQGPSLEDVQQWEVARQGRQAAQKALRPCTCDANADSVDSCERHGQNKAVPNAS